MPLDATSRGRPVVPGRVEGWRGGLRQRGERKRLSGEIDRLVAALAGTVDRPESVVAAIAAREARLREVDTILASAPQKAPLRLPGPELGRAVRSHLDDLLGLFTRQVEHGRQPIKTLCDSPIRFEPVTAGGNRRYRLEASLAIGAMFITEGVPRARFSRAREPRVARLARPDQTSREMRRIAGRFSFSSKPPRSPLRLLLNGVRASRSVGCR